MWLRPAFADAGRAAGSTGVREREHEILLRVPSRTTNGAKVPIVVDMDHPMAPEHHITRVHLANDADPIASKGTFHFTPGNGRAYLAFQARMHDGISDVTATAECTLHGGCSARRSIEIPEGSGGCSGTAPAGLPRTGGDDVRAPVIRIPELVERRRIRPGEVIHPQVKMRHPNRSGLAFRDGKFVVESDPLHLDDMEVHYGGERVSWFSMTAALADDPLISFALLATREGPLHVLLRNNRGQEFEGAIDIRFS
jgi:sulfur-oxidizing protein SoxY